MIEEIAEKISNGELTEDEVLRAIREIRSKDEAIRKIEESTLIKSNPLSDQIILERIPDPYINPSRLAYKLDLYEGLGGNNKKFGNDIKYVISKVLKATPLNSEDRKFFACKKNPKISLIKLKVFLRKENGWTYSYINEIFKCIREFCKELENI